MGDGNILILGSSGFIGSRLAEQLLLNHQVVGYSRHTPAHLLDNTSYTQITGDFVSEQNFGHILSKYQISCIYHCISTTTPHIGTSHILSELQENVLPTLRLLEAAVECGVERVIFLSSGGTVYGEQGMSSEHSESDPLLPICSYGAQKASIEAYLNVYHHVHGLKTMIARVSNPYGLDTRKGRSQGIIPIFLRALYEDSGIILFGNTVRDFIHIDDVTNALVRLKDYTGTGHVFNIGSGTGIHLQQVVELMEQLAQKRFKSIQHLPIRDCDVAVNLLDVEYSCRELQWTPQISLEDGILGLIHQMQSLG